MRKIIIATATAAVALAYSADLVETVTVTGADGSPLRINKADYDADQADDGAKAYTLHKTEAEQSVGGGEAGTVPIDPNKQAAAPVAPSPGQRLVSKEGTGNKTKFFIVDGTGTKLTGAGIDEKGYADEQAAWAAIMAIPA